MRSKLTLTFTVLASFATSAGATGADDQKGCVPSLSSLIRGPFATTMPLPPAADVDALIDRMAHTAAEGYGESAGQIKAALVNGLDQAQVPLDQIHDIKYAGALESMPPEHQFRVTTRKGLVKDVAATASPEHSLPITAPVPPAVAPLPPVIPPPPVTTLPLPRLTDVDSALDRAVAQAASWYGENAAQILAILRANLAGIDLGQVHSIEHAGALESSPPEHKFKITFADGKSETIAVSVPRGAR